MSWMSQVCGEDENDYISVNKKYLNRLENDSKELEIYKKAVELMAAWMAGGGDAQLCQYCIGEKQELCNGYNRLHNTKEECIKTIMNYYLTEAQDD